VVLAAVAEKLVVAVLVVLEPRQVYLSHRELRTQSQLVLVALAV
jgi:hypothetical protein